MNAGLNPRLVSFNKRISLAAAVFAMLAGATVLSGYLLRNPTLKSVFPGYGPMNPTAAVCFMLIGAALFLLNRAKPGTPLARAGLVCAAAVGVVGLIKIAGYLIGQDVPIDAFLFHDQLTAPDILAPYRYDLIRVAPGAALGFLALSLALAWSQKEKTVRRGQILSIGAFFIAFISFLGYAYGTDSLQDLVASTPISLASAVTLMMLSIGTLLLRPEWGMARILSSRQSGGMLLRRLIPFVFLLTLGSGIVADRVQDAGHAQNDLVDAIQDVVETAVFLVIIFWTAANLEKTSSELQSEKSKTDILLESIGDGVVAIDRSWKIVSFNHAAGVMTGWSKEEVVGGSFRDFLKFTREKDGRENFGFIEKVLATGEAGSMENHTCVTTKEGRKVFVGDSASPIFDEEGRVSGVIIVFRDVSKEREIETEKEHQREELEKLVDERTVELRGSLARFKSVMENSPIAIFSTDKDGILTFREGKGGARAGVKPGQDVGVSYFEQFPDVPKHLESVRRALRGETLTDRLTVRDGFFEITYTPMRDAAGNIDGMVGVATDITERQKAETDVKELSELKNKFITVVSHQLRTPLSVVRWNLETIIAEDMGKLKKEQKEFLRVTHDANGEVITRINDFLLALDIEELRTTVTKESTSLESLWQSIMIDVVKRCELRGLKCAYVPPKEDLPAVQADADKIRVVMEKLADNAANYTTEGSVKAKLSVIGGRFRFEIADTGIGIPKAEQPRLFHRFFRASNALHLRTDASGLGLYIAKHYVESHGGKIGFESEEGKGSTFWFEIPLV